MKVCLIALGCPKNIVEGEGIAAQITKAGHVLTTDVKDATAAIVHTCSFINDAKAESWGVINRLVHLRRSGTLSKIIVCGCMAQELKHKLRKSAPEIDIILGTGQLHNVANMLAKDNVFTSCKSPGGLLEPIHGRILSSDLPCAYIRIAEGCNHKCAFCVIPSLRGPYISRSIASVVREAEALAGAGITELNIAAQDTTVFGRDRSGKLSLVKLLGRLNAINGLRWIRLMYAYPNTVTDSLLDAICNLPNVCKYIDIPLQHVSKPLLRRMGRPENARSVIDRIVSRAPDISIRTSFITGFPGENDQDFSQLCDFVKEGWFEHVGVFEYSDNINARAHCMRPQVHVKTAKIRRRELMRVQKVVVKRRNGVRLGQEFDVLIERPIEGKHNLWRGRTSFQAPEIDSIIECKGTIRQAAAGRFVRVRVTSDSGLDLCGDII